MADMLHAFMLRVIARAATVAGDNAPAGTSRERQGYAAAMMLEHAAAQVDGTLCRP